MGSAADDEHSWVTAFHRGDRSVLRECYLEHYQLVAHTVARYLSAADAETAVHEVFYKLIADASTRQNFTGGSFPAWLTRVASNHALRLAERTRREVSTDTAPAADVHDAQDELDAKLMIERFRREVLPAKWQQVFEVRFLRGLDQRSAANELGMFRTTLAYQELRIRALLRDYFVGRGAP